MIENKKEIADLSERKRDLESRLQNIELLEESNRLKDSESIAASEAVESLQDEKAKLVSQLGEINASVELYSLECRQVFAARRVLRQIPIFQHSLYKKTVQDLTAERHNLLSQIEQVNSAWQSRLDAVNSELEGIRGENNKLKATQVDENELSSIRSGLASKDQELNTQLGIVHKLKVSVNAIARPSN